MLEQYVCIWKQGMPFIMIVWFSLHIYIFTAFRHNFNNGSPLCELSNRWLHWTCVEHCGTFSLQKRNPCRCWRFCCWPWPAGIRWTTKLGSILACWMNSEQRVPGSNVQKKHKNPFWGWLFVLFENPFPAHQQRWCMHWNSAMVKWNEYHKLKVSRTTCTSFNFCQFCSTEIAYRFSWTLNVGLPCWHGLW